MKKYRIVFIGNRPRIFSGLLAHPRLDLLKAFVVKGALIENVGNCSADVHYVSGAADRGTVLDYLSNGEFDLCVSAGCPYILPISKLPPGKVFINSHPSVLPLGRGKHPINEAILSGHNKAGATVHYMVDEIDAGDIIYQKSFDLTDEVDLGLLYSFIFDLEYEVFSVGLEKLISCDLGYCGYAQTGPPTYFSRSANDFKLDIGTVDRDSFLRRIRALAFGTMDVIVFIARKKVAVHSAVAVVNPYINERFSNVPVGDVIFWNDSFILLKLKGGIIRINKWSLL